MASFTDQLRRGHLISRFWQRTLRDSRAILTTLSLTITRPHGNSVAIATLNADEENATVQAVLLNDTGRFDLITFVTPSPQVSRLAVGLAARRLGVSLPVNIEFTQLSYRSLLKAYCHSALTYSTHVLLPGVDKSSRRRHVHLTHGSGPKPDTTFRGPANVLASITPQWAQAQLREYKLPPTTEVISYMPRLKVMRLAVGDASVLERLHLDPARPLIVWAPTYRKVRRANEIRISGRPFSILDATEQKDLLAKLEKIVAERSGVLVIKPHPHDADNYHGFDVPVHTNSSLQKLGVTPYELFGAAEVLVTDYSSLYIEREYLGLEFRLLRPDQEIFASSYRGLRKA